MDSKKKKEEKKSEEEDTRIPCKYGGRCYQKNPDHRKKYWHPPAKVNVERDAANNKKRKSPENSGESGSTEEPKPKKPSVAPSPKKPEDEVTEEIKTKAAENVAEKESDKVPENDVNKVPEKDVNKVAEKDVNKVPEKDVNEASEKDESKALEKDANEALEKDVDETLEKTEDKTPEKTADQAPEKAKEKTPEKPVKQILEMAEDSTPVKIAINVPEKVANDKPKTISIVKKDEDPHVEMRKLISKFFRVNMPMDFYKFYDFCNELKPSDPSTAFKIADIKLVGPYDVLNGLITKNTPESKELFIHWRYYYDPPEFQTILKGNDKEGLHFGYWRDRPSSDPVFVATNCSNVSHKIKPAAENVFGAVANYLEEKAKKANPFEKTGFFNLLGKLKAYAKKYNIPLEAQTPKMKSREKNVVARTIHGAGIVCPYNKKTQLGYRELTVTDNQLLKIVKKIDDAKSEEDRATARVDLDEVVRCATIAGDECDFGTCLELGHDLLSTGCVHVQNAALDVFSIAYNQLDRQLFLEIVETHMKNRKKGVNNGSIPNASRECTK